MEHRIGNYEELYEQFSTEANLARQYLLDTDRIVLECLELNKPIPDDIRQARAKAREAVDYNSGKAADLWDLDNISLFPTWQSMIGKAVAVGERYQYDGRLWKVLQAHTVQADWTPDTAVSLFVEVSVEEWPAWKQPTGSTDAYNIGDKVTHNDKHWISFVDGNVWEPGVYGWNEA